MNWNASSSCAGPETQFSLCSPVRACRTMGYYSNTLGAGHGSALEDHERWLHRTCLWNDVKSRCLSLRCDHIGINEYMTRFKHAQVISVSFNIFQLHDQLCAAKEAFSCSPSQLSPRCSSHSQYSGNLYGALADAASFALESCESLMAPGKASESHQKDTVTLCLWHWLRTWLLRLPFFGIWVFP